MFSVFISFLSTTHRHHRPTHRSTPPTEDEKRPFTVFHGAKTLVWAGPDLLPFFRTGYGIDLLLFGKEQAGETTHYLSIYVFLAIVVVVLSTCRDLGGNIFGFRAARRLHRQMFESVLHAPMSFFQEMGVLRETMEVVFTQLFGRGQGSSLQVFFFGLFDLKNPIIVKRFWDR